MVLRVLEERFLGLFHFKPGEKSVLRKMALMLYARFEIPYVKLNYFILQGPYRNRIGRLLFSPLIYVNVALMLGLGQHGKVMTGDELANYLDSVNGNLLIAVGSCRCRLGTKACSCPMKSDITIKTGAAIYKGLFEEDYEVIDKEKAKELIRSFNKQGLVPMIYAFCVVGGSFTSFVICNCCKHSCIPILAQRIANVHVFDPGDYIAYVDKEKCKGCGECIEVCQFDARRLKDGEIEVDPLACYGCGACALNCPNNATTMVKRPESVRKAQLSRLTSFWRHEHYEIN